MKLIFLDHDGVICLKQHWGKRFTKRNKEKGGFFSAFDPFGESCVRILNEILLTTGCNIVVSSTWREYGGLEVMKELYVSRGIEDNRLISETPVFLEARVDPIGGYNYADFAETRSREILAWIKEFEQRGNKVVSWCAIDDLDMSKWLGSNFIYTKYTSEGIKQCGIKEKVIDHLGGISHERE